MSKKHPVDITTLPNVRKLFIPDPGYVMCEADLSGADALVVAKEANDAELMQDIISGIDLHSKNATSLFGAQFTSLAKESPARYELRQQVKQGVHATNYGALARTLALILGWTVTQAERFQRTWFKLHPGIEGWQLRTAAGLHQSRSVTNAYGYRIIYFDRIDAVLPQALAWLPQSTVAETCFRGILQAEDACPWVDSLMQVHDSFLFQVPVHRHPDGLIAVMKALRNAIPYKPEPLIIPWKMSSSHLSWGDCEEIKLAA